MASIKTSSRPNLVVLLQQHSYGYVTLESDTYPYHYKLHSHYLKTESDDQQTDKIVFKKCLVKNYYNYLTYTSKS